MSEYVVEPGEYGDDLLLRPQDRKSVVVAARGELDPAVWRVATRVLAEDDATVERVAKGMYSIHRLPESSTDGSTSPRWGLVPVDLKDYWRRLARAALRALREVSS